MNLIKSDKKFYLNLASYLVLSLPIFIIFSRFLADFSIVLLSILFFIIRGNNKILENKIILISFIFIFFSTISSILSSNILISVKSSLLHIRFIFFSLAVSLVFIYFKENFLKKLFYIFLGCYLVFFIDATFQFIFKQNIIGYIADPTNRISSFFFDELVLGSYLVRLFPIVVFLYFLLNIKFNKYFIIYFLSHLYFVTFITGERVAFFMLIIYYIFFGILLIKKIKYKLIYIIIFILILLLTNFSSNILKTRTSLESIHGQFTEFNYTICNNTKKQIKSEPELKKKWNTFVPNCDPIFEVSGVKFYHYLSIMHFNHYITAFEIFKDNKYFGIGPKNYRFVCNESEYYLNEFSCSTHPHNYYIQLLAETGLFGSLSFIFIYLTFLYLFFRVIFKVDTKHSLLKLILITSFLVNFLPILPSGNFFNNWISILYSFPLGLLLGIYKLDKY